MLLLVFLSFSSWKYQRNTVRMRSLWAFCSPLSSYAYSHTHTHTSAADRLDSPFRSTNNNKLLRQRRCPFGTNMNQVFVPNKNRTIGELTPAWTTVLPGQPFSAASFFHFKQFFNWNFHTISFLFIPNPHSSPFCYLILFFFAQKFWHHWWTWVNNFMSLLFKYPSPKCL